MAVVDPHDGRAVAVAFGDALLYTVRREKREAMTSPLYDLPRRSAIGFEAIRATSPELMRRLGQFTTPEEIGERMRAPLMRPYLLQLFILMEGHFVGRELQRYRAELAGQKWDPGADDAADSELVATWFGRMCAALRGDGKLFPGEHVLDQPVLRPEQVDRIAAELRPPADDLLTRARRVFGTLELYALTLHGEQRDGNCDHGPYPLADGIMVMHEVNDLRNDYLSWSRPEVRLDVDAVGVSRSHDRIGTQYDMFGTMSYADPEVTLREVAFWVRDGDQVRAVEIEELEQIADKAAEATGLLYRDIASWDEEFKISYGGPLFANHLVPIIRLAEAPAELEQWYAQAIDEATAAAMPWIREASDAVWQHFASAQSGEEFFSPHGGS